MRSRGPSLETACPEMKPHELQYLTIVNSLLLHNGSVFGKPTVLSILLGTSLVCLATSSASHVTRFWETWTEARVGRCVPSLHYI
ncbi:hypothetical protein N657DRAFT_255310 [Parathielavia appendiculata]|uniref:Uncharacterized protein n=1 Tax=Parathielavia appendiculata TaxID=2587402 RepID=A0AAN6TRU7_9PEZI|nr:hypothetical protein N657DRAFT_255310 [Parathielavia appendiculata]